MQECDEVLQRQFEELSRGLTDSAPAVRMTAAAGICAVLNVYWELVPAGVTAAYLKRLTGMLHRGMALTLPCCITVLHLDCVWYAHLEAGLLHCVQNHMCLALSAMIVNHK